MARFAVILVLAGAIGAVATAAGLAAARGAFGGCGIPERGDCLRVLFIGNSYTATNDLPGTFARLARSAGFAVDVSAIAPGGQTLGGHAADPAVRGAVANGRWTAVVLQEQSEIPAITEAWQATMAPAAASLVRDIRATRATPYLLETWAHREGWPARGLDRAAMQAAIDASYQAIASSLGVVVAPAGRAWALATQVGPSIALWQADGSHPTPAGTYLTAAVLLRTTTGRNPVGLAETDGLSAADATTLQRVAAETIP
jgi:hypothetical protein